MPSLVVVFDFDESLVPVFAGRLVAHELGRGDVFEEMAAEYARQLRADPTTLDCVSMMAAVQGPFTAAEVRAAAGRAVPMDPAMAGFLRRLAATALPLPPSPPAATTSTTTAALDRVELFIVSGNNDAVIEGVLEHQLGPELFAALRRRTHFVHAHRVADDETSPAAESPTKAAPRRSGVSAYRRESIVRFSPRPSAVGTSNPDRVACARCLYTGDPQMCKGAVIDAIRTRYAPFAADATVAYVGDGRNDMCALSHLTARDVFFVKRGARLHTALGMPVGAKPKFPTHFDEFGQHDLRVHQRTTHGVCTILPWASYEDELVPALDCLMDPWSGSAAVDAAIAHLNGAPDALDARRLHHVQRLLRAPVETIAAPEDPAQLHGQLPAVTFADRMPNMLQATLLHNIEAGAIDATAAARAQALIDGTRRGRAVTPVVPCGGGGADARDDEDRGWWADLVMAAVDDARLPMSLVACCGSATLQRALELETATGATSVRAAVRAALMSDNPDDGPVWPRMPWLHGEILTQRLFQRAMWSSVLHRQQHRNDAEDTAAAAGVAAARRVELDAVLNTFKADHCHVCAEAQGGGIASGGECGRCAFVGPSAFSSGPVEAPWWDFYRFEKAAALRATLPTRIIPTVEACWAELESVAAMMVASDGAEFPEAVEGRALALIRCALLASAWGNTVDQTIYNAADLAASAEGDGDARSTAAYLPGGSAPFQALLASLAGKVEQGDMLADETPCIAERIWGAVLRTRRQEEIGGGGVPSTPRVVDLLLDNSSVELAADVVLAVVAARLVAAGASTTMTNAAAVSVCLHCKPAPYFVSDATPHDIALTLEALRGSGSAAGKAFADTAIELIHAGRIVVRASALMMSAREVREQGADYFDRFFTRSTTPAADSGDEGASPPLPMQWPMVVPRTSVVISKGDLNHATVVGERFWKSSCTEAGGDDEVVDFAEAVAGFWPSPESCVPGLGGITLAALRVSKTDLIAGVRQEVVASLDASAPPMPPGAASDSAAYRAWVYGGWRVNATKAVGLVYPATA